ncbi:Dynactin subunit 5 [Lasiodiplodia hormozganensis]|uniref:Dynactin subunit 5 n=2 Tax=Lasiodiplodia TaxID=66739 RepID=A0A5N5DKL3_9PEZI|nr:Dynactin subunit 5 [Lasiodiplodia theobromae]KAB2578425.1 Dynactin subunit 5 [Lasiodiplodia theobromae]KAF4544826.1 Dynactin subunit 5 [Lasiodiplodia theobromae]KAK0659696.1 Dynactin subunit 5 [Lasiodiplodia hormozganensis]
MSRPTAARKAPKGEYIETDSGNKVSRKAHISGTANITLGGKTVIMADVHLRGDLHRLKTSHTSSDATGEGGKSSSSSSSSANAISIGRCTVIGAGCVIKPPSRISRGQLSYYPMKIGDNVFVGAGSHISAASISSHVHVGEGCILEPFCIVRDNVKILPRSVVPANMVIPSNSIAGGRPARVVGELGEGWGVAAGGGGGGEGGPMGQGEVWVEGGDLRELVRSVK